MSLGYSHYVNVFTKTMNPRLPNLLHTCSINPYADL